MFEKLVASLLVPYLSEYAENVDAKQLNLDLWNGKATLNDLVLKPNVLNALQLPLRLFHGECKKVSIEIPLKSLRSKPVVIEIDEMMLCAIGGEARSGVVLSKGASLDLHAQRLEEALNAFEAERKRQRAAAVAAATVGVDGGAGSSVLPAPAKGKGNVSSSGYFSQLAEVVVNNIIIKVKTVHVRFEDPSTNTVVGAVLGGVRFVTTDDAGTVTFVDPTNRQTSHKKLEFDGLQVYCDDPTEGAAEPAGSRFYSMEATLNGWMRRMRQRCLDGDVMRSTVFGPVAGSVDSVLVFKAFMKRLQQMPYLTMTLRLENVMARLSRMQYVTLLRTASMFTNWSDVSQFYAFRPRTVGVSGNCREWWRYAIRAVIVLVREPRREALLERISEVCIPDYHVLYRDVVRKSEMSADKQRAYRFITRFMTLKDMIAGRKYVYAQLSNEIQMKRKDSEAKRMVAVEEQARASTGWFSWLTRAADKPTVVQEEEVMYEAIEREYGLEPGHEGDEADGAPENGLPPGYCWMNMALELPVLGVQAELSASQTSVLMLQDLGCKLRKYNKERSVQFSIVAQDLTLSNPSSNEALRALLPDLVCGIRDSVTAAAPLLRCSGALNPIEQPLPDTVLDLSLSVKLLPLRIVADPETIETFVRFFELPRGLDITGMVESTRLIAANAGNAASVELSHALMSAKSVQMTIDAAAPVFILPRSLTGSDHEPALAVSLGTVVFHTDPLSETEKSRRQMLTTGDADLLYYTSQAQFENFYVEVTDIRRALRNPGTGFLLIPHVVLTADVLQRISDTSDERERFVVRMHSKQLRVALSVHQMFVVSTMMERWRNSMWLAGRDDQPGMRWLEQGLDEFALNAGSPDRSVSDVSVSRDAGEPSKLQPFALAPPSRAFALAAPSGGPGSPFEAVSQTERAGPTADTPCKADLPVVRVDLKVEKLGVEFYGDDYESKQPSERPRFGFVIASAALDVRKRTKKLTLSVVLESPHCFDDQSPALPLLEGSCIRAAVCIVGAEEPVSIQVNVEPSVKCRLGSPMVELLEMILDTVNLMLPAAPDAHRLAAFVPGRLKDVAHGHSHEVMRLQDYQLSQVRLQERLPDTPVADIIIQLHGATTVELFDCKPGDAGSRSDYSFATLQVVDAGFNIRKNSVTMDVSGSVENVVFAVSSAHNLIAFETLLRGAPESALTHLRRNSIPSSSIGSFAGRGPKESTSFPSYSSPLHGAAVADKLRKRASLSFSSLLTGAPAGHAGGSAQPLISFSFRTTRPSMPVFKLEDGKRVLVNGTDLRFSRFAEVEIGPCVVALDVYTVTRVAEYFSTGFFTQITNLSARLRYDGKSFPPLPPAPPLLTSIRVFASRVTMEVPIDARTSHECFDAIVGQVAVQNSVLAGEVAQSMNVSLRDLGISRRLPGSAGGLSTGDTNQSPSSNIRSGDVEQGPAAVDSALLPPSTMFDVSITTPLDPFLDGTHVTSVKASSTEVAIFLSPTDLVDLCKLMGTNLAYQPPVPLPMYSQSQATSPAPLAATQTLVGPERPLVDLHAFVAPTPAPPSTVHLTLTLTSVTASVLDGGSHGCDRFAVHGSTMVLSSSPQATTLQWKSVELLDIRAKTSSTLMLCDEGRVRMVHSLTSEDVLRQSIGVRDGGKLEPTVEQRRQMLVASRRATCHAGLDTLPGCEGTSSCTAKSPEDIAAPDAASTTTTLATPLTTPAPRAEVPLLSTLPPLPPSGSGPVSTALPQVGPHANSEGTSPTTAVPLASPPMLVDLTVLTVDFTMRRLALSDQWLRVYDYVCNEAVMKALEPIISHGAERAAPAVSVPSLEPEAGRGDGGDGELTTIKGFRCRICTRDFVVPFLDRDCNVLFEAGLSSLLVDVVTLPAQTHGAVLVRNVELIDAESGERLIAHCLLPHEHGTVTRDTADIETAGGPSPFASPMLTTGGNHFFHLDDSVGTDGVPVQAVTGAVGKVDTGGSSAGAAEGDAHGQGRWLGQPMGGRGGSIVGGARMSVTSQMRNRSWSSSHSGLPSGPGSGGAPRGDAAATDLFQLSFQSEPEARRNRLSISVSQLQVLLSMRLINKLVLYLTSPSQPVAKISQLGVMREQRERMARMANEMVERTVISVSVVWHQPRIVLVGNTFNLMDRTHNLEADLGLMRANVTYDKQNGSISVNCRVSDFTIPDVVDRSAVKVTYSLKDNAEDIAVSIEKMAVFFHPSEVEKLLWVIKYNLQVPDLPPSPAGSPKVVRRTTSAAEVVAEAAGAVLVEEVGAPSPAARTFQFTSSTMTMCICDTVGIRLHTASIGGLSVTVQPSKDVTVRIAQMRVVELSTGQLLFTSSPQEGQDALLLEMHAETNATRVEVADVDMYFIPKAIGALINASLSVKVPPPLSPEEGVRSPMSHSGSARVPSWGTAASPDPAAVPVTTKEPMPDPAVPPAFSLCASLHSSRVHLMLEEREVCLVQLSATSLEYCMLGDTSTEVQVTVGSILVEDSMSLDTRYKAILSPVPVDQLPRDGVASTASASSETATKTPFILFHLATPAPKETRAAAGSSSVAESGPPRPFFASYATCTVCSLRFVLVPEVLRAVLAVSNEMSLFVSDANREKAISYVVDKAHTAVQEEEKLLKLDARVRRPVIVLVRNSMSADSVEVYPGEFMISNQLIEQPAAGAVPTCSEVYGVLISNMSIEVLGSSAFFNESNIKLEYKRQLQTVTEDATDISVVIPKLMMGVTGDQMNYLLDLAGAFLHDSQATEANWGGAEDDPTQRNRGGDPYGSLRTAAPSGIAVAPMRGTSAGDGVGSRKRPSSLPFTGTASPAASTAPPLSPGPGMGPLAEAPGSLTWEWQNRGAFATAPTSPLAVSVRRKRHTTRVSATMGHFEGEIANCFVLRIAQVVVASETSSDVCQPTLNRLDIQSISLFHCSRGELSSPLENRAMGPATDTGSFEEHATEDAMGESLRLVELLAVKSVSVLMATPLVDPADTATEVSLTVTVESVAATFMPTMLVDTKQVLYDPLLEKVFRIPPQPVPQYQLRDHVHQLMTDMVLDDKHLLLVDVTTLCTYTLDLNGYKLVLTGPPSAQIVLADTCQLTICNGTIVIPGAFSLESFVSFGLATQLFTTKSCRIEKQFYNRVPKMSYSVRGGQLGSTSGSAASAAATSRASASVRVSPKLTALPPLSVDGRPPQLGPLTEGASSPMSSPARISTSRVIIFTVKCPKVMLRAMSEELIDLMATAHMDVGVFGTRGYENDVVVRQSLKVDIRDFHVMMQEETRMLPTSLEVAFSGVDDVNISATLQSVEACFRVPLLRFFIEVAKDFAAAFVEETTIKRRQPRFQLEDDHMNLLYTVVTPGVCRECGNRRAYVGPDLDSPGNLCYLCCTGKESYPSTSAHLEVPLVDVVLIGDSGGMLQLYCYSLSMDLSPSMDLDARYNIQLRNLNTQSAVWEPILERCIGTTSLNIPKQEWRVKVDRIDHVMSPTNLRLLTMFAEDLTKVSMRRKRMRKRIRLAMMQKAYDYIRQINEADENAMEMPLVTPIGLAAAEMAAAPATVEAPVSEHRSEDARAPGEGRRIQLEGEEEEESLMPEFVAPTPEERREPSRDALAAKSTTRIVFNSSVADESAVYAVVRVTNYASEKAYVDNHTVDCCGGCVEYFTAQRMLQVRHAPRDPAGVADVISIPLEAPPSHIRGKTMVCEIYVALDQCSSNFRCRVHLSLYPVHESNSIISFENRMITFLEVLHGVDPVRPGGSFFLPVQWPLSTQLSVRPVRATNGEEYKMDTGRVAVPTLRDVLNGDTLYVQCVGVKDPSRRYAFQVRVQAEDMRAGVPSFVLLVEPRYTIHNKLPYAAFVSVFMQPSASRSFSASISITGTAPASPSAMASVQDVVIESGTNIELAATIDSPLQRLALRVQVSQRGETYVCAPFVLKNNQSTVSLLGSMGNEMVLDVVVSYGMVLLMTPFMIVNHTPLDLTLRECSGEQGDVMKTPRPMNYCVLPHSMDSPVAAHPVNQNVFFATVSYQNWSAGGLPLHVQGRGSVVRLRRPQAKAGGSSLSTSGKGGGAHDAVTINLVCTTTVDVTGARLVTIVPRWVIVNRFSTPLYVVQGMTSRATLNAASTDGAAAATPQWNRDDVVCVGGNSALPFYTTCDAPVETGLLLHILQSPSAPLAGIPFSLEEIQSSTAIAYGADSCQNTSESPDIAVDVSVTLHEAYTYVLLEEPLAAPYRVLNRTRKTLLLRDTQNRLMSTVPPFASAPLVLDKLRAEHRVRLTAVELPVTAGEGTESPHSRSWIPMNLSTFEKRVEPRPSLTLSELSPKKEPQDVAVAAGGGLSLGAVEAPCAAPLATVGTAPQSAVPEPVFLEVDFNRSMTSAEIAANSLGIEYRVLLGEYGQRVIEVVETEWDQGVRVLAPAPPPPLDVVLNVQAITVSLVNKYNDLLLAAFVDLRVHLNRKGKREVVEFSLANFQVDDQTEVAPRYEVCLFPLRHEKEASSISGVVRRTIVPAKAYVHLDEVCFSMLPLALRFSDNLLMAVVSFFGQVSGPGPDGPRAGGGARGGESPARTAAGSASATGAGAFTEAATNPRGCPSKTELYDRSPKRMGALNTHLTIENMVINPVTIRLWFAREAEKHDFFRERIHSHMAAVLSLMVQSCEDVSVATPGVVIPRRSSRASVHLELLMQTYIDGLWSQIEGIILQYASSLPLIGAPLKFAAGIGSGAARFFRDPIDGLATSPEAFVKGLASGSAGLVSEVVGGGFGAIANFASTGSKLVGMGTSRSEVEKRTHNTLSGLASGVTGIVTKPMEGIAESGASGLMKGVGIGLLGVVTNPVSGLLSDVSRLTNTAAQICSDSYIPEVHRSRQIRYFHAHGGIAPYRSAEAVYQYQRRDHVTGVWRSEALLQSDGPEWFPGPREAMLHNNAPIPKNLWMVVRYDTSFDGWTFSEKYGGIYSSIYTERAHVRRRRWIAVVSPFPPTRITRRIALSIGDLNLAEAPANGPLAVAPSGPSSSMTAPPSSSSSTSQTLPSTTRTVSIYQHERKAPIIGWGTPMFSTGDFHEWTEASSGKPAPARDDIRAPPGWGWTGPWVRAGEWQFASDARQPVYREKEGRQDQVRRRLWQRTMAALPPKALPESKRPAPSRR